MPTRAQPTPRGLNCNSNPHNTNERQTTMGVHGVDAAKKMAEEHEAASAGKFIKLADDGDKVVVAFIGEPYAREVVWIEDAEGKRKPEEYNESKHDKKRDKPRMLVSWNVYDFEQEKVRVYEQGVTFFRTWLQADEKYGRTKWAFEIKRNGAKGSTKTTYSVFPERELKADEIAALEKLDLYNLEDGTDSLGGDDNSGSNGSGAVIDADTANVLIADLKALRDGGKAEVLTAFLKEFGVEAIRDVPAALKDKALAFVAQHKGTDDKPAERDPFA